MNTEADFRAAMRLAPDDNLLRSAYADFLEENGDPRAAWVRDDVVRVFAGPEYADPLPAVLAELRSPTSQHRVQLAKSAAIRLRAVAVPGLVGLLADADFRVRLRAAQALGSMCGAQADAVPALQAAAGDTNARVRWAVGGALRRAGGHAGAEADLLDRLASRSPDGRAAAALALAALFPAGAAGPILALGRDHNATVRRTAVTALGRLGRHRPQADALVPFGDDPEDDVRLAALDLLGEMTPTPAVIDLCLRRLEDRAERVRFRAADVLRGALPADPALFARITPLLRHHSPDVRLAAVYASQSAATDNPLAGWDVVAPFVERLGDETDRVALAALNALRGVRALDARAAGPLKEIFRRARAVRAPDFAAATACRLLRLTGPVPPGVVARVLADLTDDLHERREAMECLRALGPAGREAVPRLAYILLDERAYAGTPVCALASIGTPEALAVLRTALFTPGLFESVNAHLAVMGPDAAAATSVVAERLAAEPTGGTRIRLVRTLANITPSIDAEADLAALAAMRSDIVDLAAFASNLRRLGTARRQSVSAAFATIRDIPAAKRPTPDLLADAVVGYDSDVRPLLGMLAASGDLGGVIGRVEAAAGAEYRGDVRALRDAMITGVRG